jgi:hypothetical protein
VLPQSFPTFLFILINLFIKTNLESSGYLKNQTPKCEGHAMAWGSDYCLWLIMCATLVWVATGADSFQE